MLPYNLHSHTSRCGHAYGTDEEYVLAAIKAGFRELGFTDHVMLPRISQPGMRGEFFLLDDYVRSVLALKEKYKDIIAIYLGFEAEWLGERYEEYYRSLFKKHHFDYLIMGQHCFNDRGHMTWYANLGPVKGPQDYANDLLEGMESGLFTYVAHPDIYVHWCGAWNQLASDIAHRIAFASKRLDIPLEINCGYRSKIHEISDPDCLIYPCHRFWDIVAQYGCPVVIGIDAHDPDDYAVTQYQFYEDFAKQHGLNLLRERPSFRK